MVTVRDQVPLQTDGTVDIQRWYDRVSLGYPEQEQLALKQVLLWAQQQIMMPTFNKTVTPLEWGLSIADVLLPLRPDIDTLIATILAPLSNFDYKTLATPSVQVLLRGLDTLHQTTQRSADQITRPEHRDNLRKMLLAMVEDVRVVLIRLAEQVVILREALEATEIEQKALAEATQEVYAPLAHRLGIGQIKWELEDFMFRYAEPVAYKQIARWLDEKRKDREQYIQQVLSTLKEELHTHHITAQVQGRAKHIYSIWRKVQKKNLPYDDIYDIRAVRIIVENTQECYTALGIVHALWQYIPKEFDDYIAHPKPNGYRSLHTAVMGPQGRTLEIQIRTQQMHQEAELGVAAHWRYKEALPNKDHQWMNLRQILDWQDQLGEASYAYEIHRSELWDDRVYVFTSKGEVLDLPTGATVLDFAYHVHTDLGHRCRGAKINGQIVPLTRILQSGDQVDILGGKQLQPSRDWLNAQAGYLATTRARSKVLQWFKQQERGDLQQAGRLLLEKEMKRANLASSLLPELVQQEALADLETLWDLIGRGQKKASQVVAYYLQQTEPASELSSQEPILESLSTPTLGGQVRVGPIGRLQSHLAQCCQPVPGDPIIGYVTVGRGITVHRADCSQALALSQERPERILAISWDILKNRTYPVDIMITAHDRRALLSDISRILAQEQVNITAVQTKTHADGIATMQMRMHITELSVLTRVLTRIMRLPSIIEAKRMKPGSLS